MSVSFIADNLDETANKDIVDALCRYGERSNLHFRVWYYENEARKLVAMDCAEKHDGINILMPKKPNHKIEPVMSG